MLTTAFLAFAMVSFFRKSVPLKYVTFVMAVGYMGFYKSNLISVVNIFGVIDWNLPIVKHNVMWYVFALFTVISTVLWGRLYCGRICAFGALTQLMDATLPKKLRVEPPAWLEQRAAWIKYGLLAAVIVYYLVTRNLMVYRYVEPFWMFGLSESWGLWIGLAVLLDRDRVREESLLPVPVPGRRHARHHLEPHGLQDQAVVGVQDLQALREDLRVGRDSGAEDRQERMRALRRLRAALHGSEEVPALDHHLAKSRQGGRGVHRREGGCERGPVESERSSRGPHSAVNIVASPCRAATVVTVMNEMSRRELLLALPALALAPRAFAQAKPQIPVKGFNHFTLSVSDVKRSLDFYQGLFGMPIQARQGQTIILRIGTGPQFLGLSAAGSNPPSINHLCMSVDNFNVDRIDRRPGAARGDEVRRGRPDEGARAHARTGSGRRKGRHARAATSAIPMASSSSCRTRRTAAAPACSAACASPTPSRRRRRGCSR